MSRFALSYMIKDPSCHDDFRWDEMTNEQGLRRALCKLQGWVRGGGRDEAFVHTSYQNIEHTAQKTTTTTTQQHQQELRLRIAQFASALSVPRYPRRRTSRCEWSESRNEVHLCGRTEAPLLNHRRRRPTTTTLTTIRCGFVFRTSIFPSEQYNWRAQRPVILIADSF